MLEEMSHGSQKKALKIEAEAQRLGGEWGFFSQSVFLKDSTFGAAGVCACLVKVFLARMASGEGDFDSYVMSSAGREEVMSLRVSQGGASQEYYLNHYGLKKVYSRLGEHRDTISELIRVKGYYDIGMSDVEGAFDDEASAISAIGQGQGHAIAIINDGSNFYFFDPNYGVGAFPSASAVSDFLKRYWKNIYQKYSTGSTTIDRYRK